MKINLDRLSEKELVQLNHRIVERLKMLSQMRTRDKMYEFNIGERVSFHPEGYPIVTGMVTKRNKKTITVITDKGEHWNVAPMLLEKVEIKKQNESHDQIVIPFQKQSRQ